MYLRFHKLQLYCNPLQTLSNITISRRSIKKNNLKNNILFNIHCFIKLKIFCFDSLNNEREKMSNWSHLKKYYNLNTPCKISSPVQCCLEQWRCGWSAPPPGLQICLLVPGHTPPRQLAPARQFLEIWRITLGV